MRLHAHTEALYTEQHLACREPRIVCVENGVQRSCEVRHYVGHVGLKLIAECRGERVHQR